MTWSANYARWGTVEWTATELSGHAVPDTFTRGTLGGNTLRVETGANGWYVVDEESGIYLTGARPTMQEAQADATQMLVLAAILDRLERIEHAPAIESDVG